MPSPENSLIKHRHQQIFIDDPTIEPVPPLIGAWLEGFIERLARLVRSIGRQK